MSESSSSELHDNIEGQMESKDNNTESLKYNNAEEVKRGNNSEENSFFICNFFYCFFFRFVCRIKPIRNSDIYNVEKADNSDNVYNRIAKNWDPVAEKYFSDLQKYEKNKAKTNGFVFISHLDCMYI